MSKIILPKGHDLAGFVAENVPKGETVAKLITRNSMTSDEPKFYKYIEQISNIFLNKIGGTTYIANFLILIHQDTSAEVYIGDLGIMLNINSKRDIKKGEAITRNDIADIKSIKFKNIDIEKTDKLIVCLKIGWKFGLFFDFNYEKKLDIDGAYNELGDLYRYLEFQYVYNILESDKKFDSLLKDGWFPFIEILGDEYKKINDLYENNKFNHKEIIEKIVTNFDKNRLLKITSKWWAKDLFKDKKQILEAGVEAYLSGNASGYITSIKTLLSEIEGIIRIKYFKDKKKDKMSIAELIEFIIEKGREKSGSEYSLYLLAPFLEYLKKVAFNSFDLKKNDVCMSRHSSGHGVAPASEYTKERALQAILCLDQIYYYL